MAFDTLEKIDNTPTAPATGEKVFSFSDFRPTSAEGPAQPPGSPPAPNGPTIQTAPAAVAIEPGSGYSTPSGRVQVIRATDRSVTFDLTLADGTVLEASTLPISDFQKMTTAPSEKSEVAPSEAQPGLPVPPVSEGQPAQGTGQQPPTSEPAPAVLPALPAENTAISPDAGIGVRLMRAGKWRDLGLTAQNAGDLAATFITGLAHHGKVAHNIAEKVAMEQSRTADPMTPRDLAESKDKMHQLVNAARQGKPRLHAKLRKMFPGWNYTGG